MTDHIVFTTEDPAFLDMDTNVEVRETYSLGTAPHAAALVHQGRDGVLDALTDRANLALDERVAAVHAEFEAHLQTAPTDTAGNEIHVSESATDVATLEDVRSLHSVPDNDRTGAGATAVVMDTGIDPSHKTVPDTVKWVDVTDNPTDSPTDVVGHGTAVAGQISRLASDASLVGLRIFGGESSTSGRTIMRAYDWLFKNADRLDVVNMSWGSPKRIPELDKIHDALIGLGVHGVVAAGNSGQKGGSPATADKAFSVGAVTEDGTLTDFSSYNPEQDNPDVCTIGKDCRLAQAKGTAMGTNLNGPWIKASGTSFSAPSVSGMVAKLLSGDTNVAPPKITSAFEGEAADIPTTPHDGAGIAKCQAMYNAVDGQRDQLDQDALIRSDSNTTSRIDNQVMDRDGHPITDFDSAEESKGGGSGSDGGPSMNERLAAVDPSGNRDPVAVHSASDYKNFINGISVPENSELGAAIADGSYNPPAMQRTLLWTRPEYSTQVRGNVDNPYAVDLSRANHNFTILIKDEHFRIEGMLWGRTQFSGCGDPYIRNMAFTDRHGKGHSAIGGKRACGRFIDCDIGHKDAPDEYAAYYYGGGEVLFDRKNTFRATGDAYIGANNHVTINISNNNDFASGDKELVKGSGIYPSMLSNGMNVIKNGKLYQTKVPKPASDPTT